VLNAVLFISDPHLAGHMRTLTGKSNEFTIESVVQLTEITYSSARVLNTASPDVILLEMSDFGRDMPMAAMIHQHAPNVPFVGLVSRDFREELNNRSDASFASLVAWPFAIDELEQAISKAVHQRHGGIHENLIAFLPGKAGSGASTVVLHTVARNAGRPGPRFGSVAYR
jgi:AmiR/NasT family two-component response regulator